MPQYHVTLKAHLQRGEFYWTCDVTADSEEEAVAAAENLFEAEIEEAREWSFAEFQVEPV